MSSYQESKPIQLSDDIFKLYQYVIVDNNDEKKNTGLMIEDGCFELMFIQEENVSLILANKKVPLPKCFTLCKPPLPYKFDFPEKLSLFTVKIQPWATTLIIPKLSAFYINLESIFGTSIEDFHQRLFQTKSFSEKVQLFEHFISDKIKIHEEDFNLSKQLCLKIEKANGIISVNKLMDEFPQYRQKINEIFLEQTYNSIKEYITYVKVRTALKFKLENPKITLTELSYHFGYFDQSHFIKDIKKATGISPSKFFKNYNLFTSQLK